MTWVNPVCQVKQEIRAQLAFAAILACQVKRAFKVRREIVDHKVSKVYMAYVESPVILVPRDCRDSSAHRASKDIWV